MLPHVLSGRLDLELGDAPVQPGTAQVVYGSGNWSTQIYGTTRRFGGTAQTAGTLYGALSPSERGQTILPGGKLDAAVLSGRSANDVMDAVVEAVRPTDGTQDAEASRVAIKEALSELLTKFPDAFLLELTEKGGMPREDAYRIVQGHAMNAFLNEGDFKALVLGDPQIVKTLGPQALEHVFDLSRYLQHTDTLFTRVFEAS